ncbi:hypothetical protein CRI94_13280 [Longibacter salinarum]|uniref:Uncharacterized protein n=1 Tax=Longibacter salinarum TaxID=1850348 RepID=A0A2A8CWH6_9BACT|nr:hypothetical protein CRI94_13280 [Longibacter salinarum]
MIVLIAIWTATPEFVYSQDASFDTYPRDYVLLVQQIERVEEEQVGRYFRGASESIEREVYDIFIDRLKEHRPTRDSKVSAEGIRDMEILVGRLLARVEGRPEEDVVRTWISARMLDFVYLSPSPEAASTIADSTVLHFADMHVKSRGMDTYVLSRAFDSLDDPSHKDQIAALAVWAHARLTVAWSAAMEQAKRELRSRRNKTMEDVRAAAMKYQPFGRNPDGSVGQIDVRTAQEVLERYMGASR